MGNELRNILLNWPKRVVRDIDLIPMMSGSDSARHNALKRAVQQKVLLRIVRGVYLILEPYSKLPINRFEIAQMLEGIAYISFESALAYHQLIPEAVYVTSCATSNRSREIHTEIGDFSFQHLPLKNFFLGVERVTEGSSVYLMATPWRALADHFFIFKRPWEHPESIFEDLRIEEEDLAAFSKESLKQLTAAYPSPRVRKFLKQLAVYMGAASCPV